MQLVGRDLFTHEVREGRYRLSFAVSFEMKRSGLKGRHALELMPGASEMAAGGQPVAHPDLTAAAVDTDRAHDLEDAMLLVVFDPSLTTYASMLKLFWEGHDTTQGMRQGNDVGAQYRSCIFTSTAEQAEQARESLDAYQKVLTASGFGTITTEISVAPAFFYAEGYHQQYLAKNPNGYCGLGGTGLSCPVGLVSAPSDDV